MTLWPFAKKRNGTQGRGLVFKSGEDAFEAECKFRCTAIERNVAIVALVLKADVGNDGVQHAVLKVASDDGGFCTSATTPSGGGERLKAGDLVYWVPYRYCAEIASGHNDPRAGWIGFIRAKLLPEYHKDSWEFVIVCRYDGSSAA